MKISADARNRKPNLSLNFILSQLFFWVGSALFVGLYARTMLFIRVQKAASNSRLDTLSNIFAILAVSWLFCEGPHVMATLLEYPVWALSGCTDNFFHNCNWVYCADVRDRLLVANQITLMLKNLFPVVNTLLLILLIRPLQQPILRCFKLCRRQARG